MGDLKTCCHHFLKRKNKKKKKKDGTGEAGAGPVSCLLFGTGNWRWHVGGAGRGGSLGA